MDWPDVANRRISKAFSWADLVSSIKSYTFLLKKKKKSKIFWFNATIRQSLFFVFFVFLNIFCYTQLASIFHLLNFIFFLLTIFSISFAIILVLFVIFFFIKIFISFTSILILYVFFFRKVSIPFTNLFYEGFFCFFW